MPRILKPTGCSIKHVSNGRNFFDDEQFLIEQWGEIPFEITFLSFTNRNILEKSYYVVSKTFPGFPALEVQICFF